MGEGQFRNNETNRSKGATFCSLSWKPVKMKDFSQTGKRVRNAALSALRQKIESVVVDLGTIFSWNVPVHLGHLSAAIRRTIWGTGVLSIERLFRDDATGDPIARVSRRIGFHIVSLGMDHEGSATIAK